VYRTYDGYIKEEGASKQKVVKKKSSENAYDATSEEK
jgi:hypothetical protein